MQAAARTLITAEHTYTITNAALPEGLWSLGTREEDAHLLADRLEIGINLAAGSLAVRGQRLQERFQGWLRPVFPIRR